MLEDSTRSHEPKPPGRGLWLLFPTVALALAVLYCGSTATRIVQTASERPERRADAIVIFGAAEYAGRPSPVYRARLDHAFDLFQQGMAPIVITTGGAGDDPDFSEGGVGRDYLLRRGVPEQSLIAETQGADTAQSAVRVANIMHVNGMRSCIAVSDAYHLFRIRALLAHENIQVEVAPRPDSRPHSRAQRASAVLRETASYLAWKLGLS